MAKARQRPKKEKKALSGLEWRAARRRKRMVSNIARNWEEAEEWDLKFWQSQTPEMRLSALVSLREDFEMIKGRKPRPSDFDEDPR
jgi:SpoVK/Ycf46/Vps4 family AAA+-type ATPase